MVSDKAKHKARILIFWEKHGLEATREAFKVSRRTLYLWKQQLKKGGGKLEALNESSKRPKQVRTRHWPREVKEEIKRLRGQYPNLGKEKIHVLLQPFCKENNLNSPSVSTIGNLIRDMGGLRISPVKVRHDGTIVPRKRVKFTLVLSQFAFELINAVLHFGFSRKMLTQCSIVFESLSQKILK